jgi:hypothetical protein
MALSGGIWRAIGAWHRAAVPGIDVTRPAEGPLPPVCDRVAWRARPMPGTEISGLPRAIRYWRTGFA